MDEFNLTFRGPNILTSGNIPSYTNSLVNNVKSSNIISGISSDHSIVTAKISNDIPVRGRGYWKLNCHYLRYDAHFIMCY